MADGYLLELRSSFDQEHPARCVRPSVPRGSSRRPPRPYPQHLGIARSPTGDDNPKRHSHAGRRSCSGALDECAGGHQRGDVLFKLRCNRGIADQDADLEVVGERSLVRLAEPTSARRPSTTSSLAWSTAPPVRCSAGQRQRVMPAIVPNGWFRGRCSRRRCRPQSRRRHQRGSPARQRLRGRRRSRRACTPRS